MRIHMMLPFIQIILLAPSAIYPTYGVPKNTHINNVPYDLLYTLITIFENSEQIFNTFGEFIQTITKSLEGIFKAATVNDVKTFKTKTTGHKQRNEQSLFEASYKGDLKGVKRLIDLSVNVNAVSKSGSTALTLASEQGHDKVVDFLLRHDADFTITLPGGSTALLLATIYRHKKTVEVLLQKYFVSNKNMQNNKTQSVVDIGKKNISFDRDALLKSLNMASLQGFSEIVELFLPHITQDEALEGILLALSRHHHSVLKVFFKKYDVNRIDFKGTSLLFYWCNRGDDSNVEFLLKNNADVNKLDSSVNSTPLMTAASKGRSTTVKLLLKYNANLNFITNTGLSALFVAMHRNFTNVVKILLQHNVNVNARHMSDVTA
ncbi:ankyrin repeat and KH domain-containing protein mask-like [Physella acuta]|uniref:ankyrin repeat and KH domain-containing protein mask-like n=1 Tax=Physella acuta TaxID=109671 RepID=UPI0027DB02DB|nr:ankyrin repeat and KH domain-containing protein mask-like [Physella acuta]